MFSYRHEAMGTLWRPDWSDIQPVLELHGLWNRRVQEGLEFCFAELMKLEVEEKESANGG